MLSELTKLYSSCVKKTLRRDEVGRDDLHSHRSQVRYEPGPLTVRQMGRVRYSRKKSRHADVVLLSFSKKKHNKCTYYNIFYNGSGGGL